MAALKPSCLGLAGALALAVLAAPVHAKVYKCVDAKGRTVYSESPCPAGTRSRVLKPVSPEQNVSARPASRVRETESATARPAGARPGATPGKAQKPSAEACQQARKRIDEIDAGGPVFRVNGVGQRYALTDAEVEIEKTAAHRIQARNCR
jgi:hypothetical protein